MKNLQTSTTCYLNSTPGYQSKVDIRTRRERQNELARLHHHEVTKLKNSAIHRKPTNTDHVIANDSCHLTQHIVSGTRYLINKMLEYPISTIKKEENVIQTILHNIHFHDIIKTVQQKIKKQNKKKSSNVHNQKDKKWATFTYVGKEFDHITKLFKKQDLGVAYKTKNNIGRIFNRHININKFPK
jgi:hypothetical protein